MLETHFCKNKLFLLKSRPHFIRCRRTWEQIELKKVVPDGRNGEKMRHTLTFMF